MVMVVVTLKRRAAAAAGDHEWGVIEKEKVSIEKVRCDRAAAAAEVFVGNRVAFLHCLLSIILPVLPSSPPPAKAD